MRKTRVDWVPRNAKRDVEGETRRKGDLEMKGEKAKRPLVMIFFERCSRVEYSFVPVAMDRSPLQKVLL